MANDLLKEVLENYPFQEKFFHEKIPFVYTLDYMNSSNCEGKLVLRVLRDASLRLSITATDDLQLNDEVDLFETKGFGRIHDFMKLINGL